jgi:DNA-binding XRE family transcriptional regulator
MQPVDVLERREESMLMMAKASHASMRTPRGVTIPHLRAWREHAALSQVELAARAGLSRPTITRAETGQHVIEWPNIRKIAEVLGITVQQLREGEPTS